MKEKRNAIRRVFIGILTAIIALSLFGCGHYSYMYEEWVNEINILHAKNYKLKSYREADGGRTLEIWTIVKNEKGFDELNNIINTHNEFVRNNPDYFRDNCQVSLFEDLIVEELLQSERFLL